MSMSKRQVKLKDAERHSVNGYGRQDICYNDPEGDFVFYSDYEDLKKELEAAEKRIAELEALTSEQDQRLISYAAIATKNATAASEARTLTVKLPEGKDWPQGWKIDPEFISKVQDAIGYDEECQCWEGTPSMEIVEAVLIAAAGIQLKMEE